MPQQLTSAVQAIAAAALVLWACSDAGSDGRPSAGASSVREVVGDLGGVPVRIPIEFAESVEYDDDPGILEPRRKAAPARDFSSRLRSFGFRVRYPDMVGLGSEAARNDRDAHLPGNTFWILVGLKAGEDYVGVGSAERMASATIDRPEAITGALYQLAAERTCGLDTYVLTGNDLESGKPNQEHSNAEDIFVGRDATGKATTFIECSNRPLNAAPCTQHFDLEPQMHAQVYLMYRRGLLCEWRGIQSTTSQLISSFRMAGESK